MEILDIGCGLGQIFKILKKFGKICGIEKNIYFSEIIKEKYSDVVIYYKDFFIIWVVYNWCI